MAIRRLAIAWVILVVPLACNPPSGVPAPPVGLPHSAAAPGCGPADGPAIAIYLSATPLESLEPAAPYVRVDVWQSLEHLTERPWRVAGDNRDAAALHYSTATDYIVATGGVVTVNTVRADKTIEGSVDLSFGSARRVRGGFRAVWISRPVVCG
jgi:hypothetical protein